MENKLLGIHHVTAIAGDPQRNVDFYTGFLGLRLVKVTVNFDDPGSYHLYYGDELGRPGTILTFFVWPGAAQGRNGPGQATIVSFAVPRAALRYWAERLEDYKIPYEGPIARFDDLVLTFLDPDNLQIELVGQRSLEGAPQRIGPAPAEYAIARVCGVTMAQEQLQPTAAFLQSMLGFRAGRQAANRYRFISGEAAGESFVDVLVVPGLLRGDIGVGVIHHVAWRTPDDEGQAGWQRALAAQGILVTPVRDRQYFRSIYFREPGGVLFEIATDTPGFTTDEPAAEVGTRLMLPPWLEAKRAAIEATLPALPRPQMARGSRIVA